MAVCALIALIAFTRLQLRYWHDSVALFTRATEVTGDSILAEYNLAEALARSGEEDKAIKHYLKAIELPPNRLENWHSSKPFAQYNLGMLFANRGDWAAAEPRFRAALRSYPGSSVLRANLANSLTALGRLNEAIPQYRIALRDGQKSAEIWRGFATALDRHGDWSEAGDAYQEAARLAPQNPVDLNNLAWFLATTPKAELRNATEALTLAQAAAGLTARREPLCLASLDAAYAGAGNFDQAITAAQQTRDLALSLARQDVAQAASERLDLYRAGKPFRQQLPFPRGARE